MSTTNSGTPNQSVSQSSTASLMTTPTATTCPYHAKVLSGAHEGTTTNLDPMRRFLAEGPTEQSALFVRPDNGQLSTSKGCICKK
ncbi:hypothetical protein CC80DRAFT_110908 [Byssothecium circinans]|uniref:Uncharacterized protein n=1 Tax=Byssothecium circinans TaxID=147558 RepID=A0A6A5TRY4_9PLEO|nr:hypothetical protein CC80DRAFT_110908 [Byssothecium circinans]